MKKIVSSAFVAILTLVSLAKAETSEYKKQFKELTALKWTLTFEDDCQKDWTRNWIMDGELSRIDHSKEGMTYYAGPKRDSQPDHTVLWTKQYFKGDVRIEYDFTRIDTVSRYVNIIYIQATGSGKGPYSKDIMKWNDLRKDPWMKTYFDHMNTYHMSYAVSGANEPGVENYIRGRRYMPETGKGMRGTALKPEYHNPGMFEPGKTYHLTFIKKGKQFYFNIRNKQTNRTFFFNAEELPPIDEGYIGLRQMHARVSRYANFKVYELKE